MDTPKSKSRDGAGIQSLERAFSILETVSAHPDGIALADIAKIVNLHTSTTFHLVRTMLNLGYVRQDGDRRYRIGKMVFALAANSRREKDLISAARPILEALASETGESTHLAVFSGNEVVVLSRAAGSSVFEMREQNGGIRPGHATAIGKVLLSALQSDELERYLRNHPLTPLTPKTIVDQETFRSELAKVRALGFAYDDCELNTEVRCVAYPVKDYTENVVAAVGFSGPVWRLNLQSLMNMSERVKRAADLLSSELGKRG